MVVLVIGKGAFTLDSEVRAGRVEAQGQINFLLTDYYVRIKKNH